MDETSSSDLETERRAIMDMSIAKSSIANGISYLTSALSLRCFAKHHIENDKDIESLSKSLDMLIEARDLVSETLQPYLTFHEINEGTISEWLTIYLEEEEVDKFNLGRDD